MASAVVETINHILKEEGLEGNLSPSIGSNLDETLYTSYKDKKFVFIYRQYSELDENKLKEFKPRLAAVSDSIVTRHHFQIDDNRKRVGPPRYLVELRVDDSGNLMGVETEPEIKQRGYFSNINTADGAYFAPVLQKMLQVFKEYCSQRSEKAVAVKA